MLPASLVVALAAVLLASAMLATPALASTPAWTTYHHDSLRSGIDPDSSSPLPPTQAWQSVPLDGDIYAEPLLYGSMVYVATENDSVYALNASTGAVVWHASVGTPVPDSTSQVLPCNDINPVGITSTPVIDPSTNRIYVVAYTWDGSNISSIQYQMESFDLNTGAASAPVDVVPPGMDPTNQLQRTSLALDGHEILIGFGGNSGDCGEYHGWLVGANENGSPQLNVFEATHANGDEGGSIWGGADAPVVDSSGNILLATGNGWNGSFTNPPPQYDYSDSILKLSPSLGTPTDYWAPPNWQTLDENDEDLGSSQPLPLPDGYLLQAGKDQNVYLVHASPLGHISSPPAELQNICYGATFGASTYYDGIAYVPCYAGLLAISVNTSEPSLAKLWQQPSTGAIGPPIYAGGLVWSTDQNTGMLYGLNPETGAITYQQNYGTFMHFATPSAGGGRLFFAADDASGNPRVTALTIAKYPPPTLSVSQLSLSRRRFRAKKGTKLRLTASEPATITVVIEQRFHGRKVKGTCKRGAKHGKRCRGTHVLKRFHFSFSAKSGANVFKLRLKGLAAGHYSAVVKASAANGSTSKALGFTVVK